MDKIGLGIVGAGDHMKSHIAYLREIPDIEIVGIADKACNSIEGLLDPRSDMTLGQLKSLAPNPVFFDNAHDLYHDTSVKFDAVFSGTPDKFHTSDIEDAVKYGKHIMVEKPLATTRLDLEYLKDALGKAKEQDLVISSCHARRFDPPFLWLKSMLGQTKIALGEVMGVDYDFSYAKLRKTGLHEGLLIDHFNHEIDLLNFFLGFSHFSADKLTDSEESYQASGVRNDGVSFMFRGSRFLDTSRYHEVMTIRFQKGTLTIDTSSGTATLKNHETLETISLECGKTNYEKRLQAVNENFFRAIRGEEEVYLIHQDLIVNTASGIGLTVGSTYNSQHDI